ncbi:MAG: hypothetical protein Tsb0020_04460 [Haliangiales bacterium]
MGTTRDVTERAASSVPTLAPALDDSARVNPDRALKLSIFAKLAMWIAAIALIPLFFTTHRSLVRSEEALRGEARARLTAIAQGKVDRIETYANEQRRIVSILTQSLDVLTAFQAVPVGDPMATAGASGVVPERARDPEAGALVANGGAYDGSGGDVVEDIVGDIAEDIAEDITAPLRRYVERKEYSNLFLVSVAGEVLMSVDPHPCSGTNLTVGRCRDHPMAEVYKRAKTLLETEISRFTIVSTDDEPAAFVAAPTLQQGAMRGVVVLQLSASPIYDIINDYAGLEDSGEIIAADLSAGHAVFVSPTRHDPDAAFTRSVALGGDVMVPLQEAARGIQGYGHMRDYRGVDTVAVARYLPSMRWGLVVKQDESEALALIHQERTIVLIASAVTALLVLLVTFIVARSISRPISHLTNVVQELAKGDLEQKIVPTTRDELAVLGHWFNNMTEQLHKSYSTIEETVRLRTLELEQANHELRVARDAAESANRAKSAFLANMSHELRTPLNAVLGYTDLLLEDAHEDGDDDRASDLARIHQAGNHLLDLISDVLDLSKIEAGREDIFVEEADVSELVNSVVTTVRPRIDNNGNRLQVAFGEELGVATIDVRKTRQILLNLVDNAAKFTHKGLVSIQAERFVRDGEPRLSFAVSDTGIGIPANKFSQLFHTFEQLDSTTTRHYGGTGLGLALSQKLALIMGGKIRVASEVGQGSTFTLELPAVMAATEDGVPRPLTEREDYDRSSAGDYREHVQIVIIDDGSDSRALLRRALEGAGYAVACASNGEEGLRLVRTCRPEVVLLDVRMPGVDGWATLASLKSDESLADIPVVIVSIVDDKKRGFVLGASEYLLKPFERSRLLSAVRPYVSTHEEGRPILVVEDDEATRSATCRMLRSEGWTVREAEDGNDALAQVAAEEPALILLDLMMPDLDGFGFLEQLRATSKYAHLPVIVLTAKELTQSDMTRLHEGLAKSYQKGSINRERLVNEVRLCIAKRKYQDSKKDRATTFH